MGPLMNSSGTDNIKTAELWDVGSTFPYLRNGSKGSDLRGAILAHGGEGGEGVASANAFEALDEVSQQHIINFMRAQLIGDKLGEGSSGAVARRLPDINKVYWSPRRQIWLQRRVIRRARPGGS